MLPEQNGNAYTPIQSVEREAIAFERVRALIKVNAGLFEANLGDRFFLLDLAQRLLRLVRLAYREDGVTTHLAPERRCLTQHRVAVLVQAHTIPKSMAAYDRHQAVARVDIRRSQRAESLRLCPHQIQPYRDRTQHALAPLGRLPNALDGVDSTERRGRVPRTCSRRDRSPKQSTPHHLVSRLIAGVAAHNGIGHRSQDILYLYTVQERTILALEPVGFVACNA
jgi:hypothetical protein